MGILSHSFIPLLGALFLLPLTPAANNGFPYQSQKVRGVNLGGWLVLEPWITPSIFDKTGDTRIIDEYTFGQYQDEHVAKVALTEHWKTWITETDFEDIANAGLNHVRLPIGYWAFDVSGGEPFIQGQLPYMHKAVDWARKYNLKVVIDLHGAPGSQNGFDNSGQKMDRPQWHTNVTNVGRTDAIIKNITSTFADWTEEVPIIAPLNEPAGFDGEDILTVTKKYWKDSYANIRNTPDGKETNLIVMIHDAFQPLSYWNGFMPEPEYKGVMLDTHIYQMFSAGGNQQTYAQHIDGACATNSSLSSSPLMTVVGEWTATANDCAKYLNGRGVGSRYEGTFPGSTRAGSCTGLTGSASTFSGEYKTFLEHYWQAQAMTYERYSAGWIQWTWKAENADEWTYQAGLKHGWIPEKLTPDYKYKEGICG